jgi:curved DNA-binding protein CbpA
MANKTNSSPNYYDILGVSPLSTDDQIKQAFHKWALKMHPDRHPHLNTIDRDKFVAISTAYGVLRGERHKYDAHLYGKKQQQQQPKRQRDDDDAEPPQPKKKEKYSSSLLGCDLNNCTMETYTLENELPRVVRDCIRSGWSSQTKSRLREAMKDPHNFLVIKCDMSCINPAAIEIGKAVGTGTFNASYHMQWGDKDYVVKVPVDAADDNSSMFKESIRNHFLLNVVADYYNHCVGRKVVVVPRMFVLRLSDGRRLIVEEFAPELADDGMHKAVNNNGDVSGHEKVPAHMVLESLVHAALHLGIFLMDIQGAAGGKGRVVTTDCAFQSAFESPIQPTSMFGGADLSHFEYDDAVGKSKLWAYEQSLEERRLIASRYFRHHKCMGPCKRLGIDKYRGGH